MPMPRRPATPEAPKDQVPISRRKRILLNGLLLLVPVLFFVLLEGTLRLVGYGEAYPLFVPVKGRTDYLYQNRDVARRYFVSLKAVPNSLYDFFRAEKEPGTFRIFVQGESSAAGFPFYYGGAFSRMLEQRLEQTFPERRVEVVNTAMAAVNSHTMLDFADEIIAQKPDAVLIYAGHNEYYGALGAGSAQTVGGGATFFVRAYLRLMELRTGQALRDLIVWAGGFLAPAGKGTAPSATLMERVVGEQSIPLGSPLYEMGLRQLRSNLSDLLAKYREHGIPVLIATVASNERDQPPFISSASSEVSDDVQARLNRAAELNRRGDLAAALAAVEAAIRTDSLSADAHFFRGRLLESMGRYPEARLAYLAAKDRDELRFRAPEAVNRIIRDEAARHGAYLVDAQAALAEASPNGIIGSGLMVEHLHPNPTGYLVIADAFYEAMREERMIGDWRHYVPLAQARSEMLLTPLDSLVGTLRIRKLKGSWPFQPPGVVDVSVDTMRGRSPLERLALALFREEVPWHEANASLRLGFEAAGNYHRALQAALAAIQEYPLEPSTYLTAANVLTKQGRYQEALSYYEASNDLEESSAARTMIGSILLQSGDQPGAIRNLERAVALNPANQQALYNLSGAYAQERDYGKARTTIQQLLRIQPDHQDARRLLTTLPPG